MTRLSVVVPAYREAHHIGLTVTALRSEWSASLSATSSTTSTTSGSEAERLEIVVVDDGSDDGTAEVARAAGADVVLRLAKNRGKGAAVRAGVQVASGSVIAFTDADLAYPPSQLQNLVVAVESGFDVVIGSRCHPDTRSITPATASRSIASRVVSTAARTLRLARQRDTQCGLKAFGRDAALCLFDASVIDSFAFDIELLFLTHRYGLRLHEVPVEVINSDASTVRILRDGLAVVRDMLRIRFRSLLGRYPPPTDPTR